MATAADAQKCARRYISDTLRCQHDGRIADRVHQTKDSATDVGDERMAIVLGANQYGKAEVRMVYVDRSSPVHKITDVNVTSQLIGDFAESHLTGANDAVIATDTQKNTVYAMARTGGFGSPEEFALRLALSLIHI